VHTVRASTAYFIYTSGVRVTRAVNCGSQGGAALPQVLWSGWRKSQFQRNSIDLLLLRRRTLLRCSLSRWDGAIRLQNAPNHPTSYTTEVHSGYIQRDRTTVLIVGMEVMTLDYSLSKSLLWLLFSLPETGWEWLRWEALSLHLEDAVGMGVDL